MANDIGSVKGISGDSVNLNTQKGDGGMKPNPKAGSSDPASTQPTTGRSRPFSTGLSLLHRE